jgi:protoheme IX farnesyltransferase
LPAGRLSSTQVLTFGAVTLSLGIAYLLVNVGWLTALLGALTWILYTMVYTPLKSRTSWNTAVGAVGGAMPVAIGWAAAGGQWGVRPAALLLMVFLWQFPHFMAIAWLYRQQYAKAGLQMLTVVDPSGRRAGIQAVVAALALLPVSIAPGLLTSTGGLYVVAAFVLGVGQLICSLLFLRHKDEVSARRLLRASLVYLPALLVLLILLPLA